jgi:hypothetical protein
MKGAGQVDAGHVVLTMSLPATYSVRITPQRLLSMVAAMEKTLVHECLVNRTRDLIENRKFYRILSTKISKLHPSALRLAWK